MLSNEENEFLIRISPGAAAGRLRRYWWPLGFTDEVKGKRSPLRRLVMALEDLAERGSLSNPVIIGSRF
jgi:phthalate 4,5-dioxygenase oxygenase subunit